MSPAIGFESTEPSEKTFPVILPFQQSNRFLFFFFEKNKVHLQQDETKNSSHPMNKQIYITEIINPRISIQESQSFSHDLCWTYLKEIHLFR